MIHSLIILALLFGAALLIQKVTGGTVFPFAMTVLAQDWTGSEREGEFFSYPVLTGVLIYENAIVVLDAAGYAKPGVPGTGLICCGRSTQQIDNTLGQSGDLFVRVKRGVFAYNNSAAADLIAQTEIGDACYIVDDNTVAKTDGVGTRSVAGKIVDVDASYVWVLMPGNTISISGDLVSTNNLSDVTSKPTARANLGANLVALTLDVALLNGTAVYRIASPVAGTITKIQTSLKAALGTGNATLTGQIAAVAITTGVVTLVQAGSAAGQVNVCSPSAANTVAIGSDINFTVGGSNSVATGCTVTILIAT
jgi:hypothetical protein